MKTLFQLSPVFLFLATSVIAEVIPTAEDVQSVSIKITYGKDTSGIRFSATAEDWKKIRSHLLPAKIDPNPALWEGLADAEITKKDGESLNVTLWIPATGPGAFSVGGKYYRGGDSSRIFKAILDAHQKSIKRHEGAQPATGPDGVAPLAGLAVALPRDADDSREDAWSLRLHVPKVVWEVIGKDRPKREWTRIKADVEIITLDVDMGYSENPMTQLAERGQNRVVDLNGKRLSRDEALKRLSDSTPVLVSASGKMPDPFYLQCIKQNTLIVLFGLPSSAEYNLLPTSRGTSRGAEQEGGARQPASASDANSKGEKKPKPESKGRSQ